MTFLKGTNFRLFVSKHTNEVSPKTLKIILRLLTKRKEFRKFDETEDNCLIL